MDTARYKELLPGSDAVCNLEALLEEALMLPEFFDQLESDWNGPVGNASHAEKRLREFRGRVIERSQFIGRVAAARILRETIPPVHILGSYPDRRVAFDPLRAWINGIISNIERELETIERRRMMFLALAAAVISLLATVAAVVAAVIELSNWYRLRY